MDVVRVVCCFIVLTATAAAAAPRNYRYIRLYRVHPSPARPARQIYYPPQDRRQTLEALEAENNGHRGYAESHSEPDPPESSVSDDSAQDESLAHVDYGAHTGHGGAFGWYADFPVVH